MGVTLSCCKNKNEDNNANNRKIILTENTTKPGETGEPYNIKLSEYNNDEYSRLYSKGTVNSLNNINSVNDYKSDTANGDLQSVKKIFFYFDRFELTYKYFDDFGLSFDPYLVFKLDSSLVKVFNQKINGLEEDETKVDQTNDISMTPVIDRTYQVKKDMEQDNTKSGLPEKKFYFFEEQEILQTEEMDFWPSKTVRIMIFNKSKSQQYAPIQVGMLYMPLSSLQENGIIEGKFPVRNKMIKEIGYLYMRIKCILTKEDEDAIMPRLDDQNEETTKNAEGLHSTVKDLIVDYFKETMTLDYNFLDPVLQKNFLLKKIDLLSNIKDSEKGWDDRASKQKQEYEIEAVYKNHKTIEETCELLMEASLKQQHFVLYGVTNFLIMKVDTRDNKYLNEFLEMTARIKNEQDYDFFNILIDIFPTNNLVLIKQFSYFIFKLVEYVREVELQTEIHNPNLDFEELFTILLNYFGLLELYFKKLKDMKYEELEELRETIYWLLNSILLLITPNISEKQIILEFISKVHSTSFNNCIKLMTRLKFIFDAFHLLSSDTEVCAIIVKVFRKGVQILVDDKNINMLQNSDNPKVVLSSIKDLLLNDEKASSFSTFIKINIARYVHYPELFSSILLILIYFCADYKYPDVVRKIMDKVEISLLCSGFDLYRGNLKKIGKNINYFFYKFLAHISEINKSVQDHENGINFKHNEIREICNEFYKLFRMKQSGKSWEKGKTLIYFIKNKNLDLHEVLCCIAANLTKNTEACRNLCKDKCFFLQHITEYFLELNRDNVKKTLEKFKNNKIEKIALYLSIIDNSLVTCDNLLTRSLDTKEFFLKFLDSKGITPNFIKYHVRDLLDLSVNTLNCNNQKLKKTADIFLNNLE
jgi:hypothetical protein